MVNQLTDAERERLAILAEEMAEATQIIGKILRHGYESYNPTILDPHTNRTLLEKELGHVIHSIDMMIDANDLSRQQLAKHRVTKSVSIRRWLHHQDHS